jgi:Tol biopolymer transport system component
MDAVRNLIAMRRWLSVSASLLALTTLLGVMPSAQVATAAFPGASGKLAFERIYGVRIHLYTGNPDGGTAHRLRANSRYPHWSADGKRLLFATWSTHYPYRITGIDVAAANGSGVKQIGAWRLIRPTYMCHCAFTFDWDAGGKRIYWTASGRHYTSKIESATLSGKHVHVNSPSRADTCCVAVSPNGKWIAYVADNASGTKAPCMTSAGDPLLGLYVIPVKGGRPRRIAANASFGNIDWSPDGSRLVYAGVRPDPAYPSDPTNLCLDGLYTAGARGTGARLVFEALNHLPGAISPRDPVFSPDGRKIAFDAEFLAEGASYHREVFIANADGTGVKAATNPSETNPPFADNVPSWQPRARRLHGVGVSMGSAQTGRNEPARPAAFSHPS